MFRKAESGSFPASNLLVAVKNRGMIEMLVITVSSLAWVLLGKNMCSLTWRMPAVCLCDWNQLKRNKLC